jgi:hypothetical protein
MNWEVCSGMEPDGYGLTSANPARQKSCVEVGKRVGIVWGLEVIYLVWIFGGFLPVPY